MSIANCQLPIADWGTARALPIADCRFGAGERAREVLAKGAGLRPSLRFVATGAGTLAFLASTFGAFYGRPLGPGAPV